MIEQHDAGGTVELEQLVTKVVDEVAVRDWAQWPAEAPVRTVCRTTLKMCLVHHKKLAAQANQLYSYAELCQRLVAGETHRSRVDENILESVVLVVACQDVADDVRVPARAELLKRYYELFESKSKGLPSGKDFGGNESSYLPPVLLELLFGSGEPGRERGKLAKFSGKVPLRAAIVGSLKFARADWQRRVGNQPKATTGCCSRDGQPNTMLDSLARSEAQHEKAALMLLIQEAIREVVWGQLKGEEKLYLLWVVQEKNNQSVMAPFLSPERSGHTGPVCSGVITRWKQKFHTRLLSLVETVVRRKLETTGLCVARFPQAETEDAENIVLGCAEEVSKNAIQTPRKPCVNSELS